MYMLCSETSFFSLLLLFALQWSPLRSFFLFPSFPLLLFSLKLEITLLWFFFFNLKIVSTIDKNESWINHKIEPTLSAYRLADLAFSWTLWPSGCNFSWSEPLTPPPSHHPISLLSDLLLFVNYLHYRLNNACELNVCSNMPIKLHIPKALDHWHFSAEPITDLSSTWSFLP